MGISFCLPNKVNTTGTIFAAPKPRRIKPNCIIKKLSKTIEIIYPILATIPPKITTRCSPNFCTTLSPIKRPMSIAAENTA